LEVAAGTTLRVGPATRILTLPSAGLIVRGRLEVVGEPSRRVEFEAGAGSGEWNGILLEAGASARIERCDFSDGGSSIGLPAPGKPFIQARGGDLEVVECTFRGGARVAVESSKARLAFSRAGFSRRSRPFTECCRSSWPPTT
jgi:hypothetical protein